MTQNQVARIFLNTFQPEHCHSGNLPRNQAAFHVENSRVAGALQSVEWLPVEHPYFTYHIKIHHCDVQRGNENMPCFIIYIMYICIIEIPNLRNGCIKNAFTLQDANREICKIKATYFPYHIEVGNGGPCNIRQLFASQHRQHFDALITFSEGTSSEFNKPSSRLNMLMCSLPQRICFCGQYISQDTQC